MYDTILTCIDITYEWAKAFYMYTSLLQFGPLDFRFFECSNSSNNIDQSFEWMCKYWFSYFDKIQRVRHHFKCNRLNTLLTFQMVLNISSSLCWAVDELTIASNKIDSNMRFNDVFVKYTSMEKCVNIHLWWHKYLNNNILRPSG